MTQFYRNYLTQREESTLLTMLFFKDYFTGIISVMFYLNINGIIYELLC